ncbi:MAG: methyltransferase domain-containing protein [Candidatus Heimdallarchaeota archaeon]|nr:methyltransferase domain-containing protein [Candidatus Heimdallarchaeota archaeon]
MVKNLGIPIKNQIRDLAEQYHFSEELINRYSFYHGIARTAEIVKALTIHPKNYAIRVNTLLTTPDELIKTLLEKDIKVHQHPILNEALLVEVDGPRELKLKDKKVAIHKTAANRVLIGSNVGAPSIQDPEDLNIGDEVSITDKYGTLVGNGILMMESNEISSQKRGVAIRVTESKYRLPNFQNLKEYLRGQFIEQDLPSMLIGAQLNIKPKDRVLDLNVGEGKILTHIWQRNSTVAGTRIIAIDSSGSKIQKLNENVKRLRMTKAPFEIMKLTIKQIEKRFNRDETFDSIVISPPSSETGQRPKVSDTTNEHHILKAAKIQKALIQQAARLIKRNGEIYYNTNSLDPEENELIIRYAVDELKLTIVKQDYFIGDRCTGNFPGAEYLQYFYPDKQDTPGYFIAKLVK